jgi:hypothetical protein
MRHLTKTVKYIGYAALSVLVLWASSILASTFYAALMAPKSIEAAPEKSTPAQAIEQVYRDAKQRAKEHGEVIQITIQDLHQARITRDTATGTCFTPSGEHTNCNGDPIASFVTVRLDGSECSVMANAQGVISTHCEHR